MSKKEPCLYCIKRVTTEYYFGKYNGTTSEILPCVCIGIAGVKKFFETGITAGAKVVSSTVAEYPLYKRECGIDVKIQFIAEKIQEVYI